MENIFGEKIVSKEVGNEIIVNYMGFEKVRVGYWDDDDPNDGTTQWQKDNEEWLEKNELDNVGEFAVNVKENKWIDWDDVQYHCSWEQLMPVIQKINEGALFGVVTIHLDIEKQFQVVISQIKTAKICGPTHTNLKSNSHDNTGN